MYVGDEYKVKYVSGNWVPGLKDYGTFIGEFRGVTEDKMPVYKFVNVRDEVFAESMPQNIKDHYVSVLVPTRKIMYSVIKSMDRVEPDVVVYRPPSNISKGGKSKKNTRLGKKSRK